MNRIEGILDKSDYEFSWDYINYRIDGFWLDEMLDELYPDLSLKDLIPTLVYWMDREDEKAVVWKRILPNENETTICPILMCPDDNDFSCTLIVAEIINCGQFIEWRKIGVDMTMEWDAEKVGTTVEWFDKVSAFMFSKQDYLNMLDTFRQRLSFDKLRIEEIISKENEGKAKA